MAKAGAPYEWIPIRRLRCAKCGKPPERLVEHGTQTGTFDVSKDGKTRYEEGFFHAGDVTHLFAHCACGHRWRVRKAVQVTCVDLPQCAARAKGG